MLQNSQKGFAKRHLSWKKQKTKKTQQMEMVKLNKWVSIQDPSLWLEVFSHLVFLLKKQPNGSFTTRSIKAYKAVHSDATLGCKLSQDLGLYYDILNLSVIFCHANRLNVYSLFLQLNDLRRLGTGGNLKEKRSMFLRGLISFKFGPKTCCEMIGTKLEITAPRCHFELVL